MSSAQRVKKHRDNAAKDGWIRREYKIRKHWDALIQKLIEKLTKQEQK